MIPQDRTTRRTRQRVAQAAALVALIAVLVAAMLSPAADAALAGPGAAVIEAGATKSKRRVVENTGTACFWRGEAGSVHVSIFPNVGCLSSSCTRRIEQHLTAGIVQAPRPAITLFSRFVLERKTGRQPCTADCGGAGSAHTVIHGLGAGRYGITLGARTLGALDTATLPPRTEPGICLSTP